MTTDFNRRKFLGYSIFGAVAVAGNLTFPQAKGAAAPKAIRIGYQKNGVLVIARRQAALEKFFGAQGIAVNWVEFSSGPPMMEAMNAGSVDFGAVGDSPPIFAQAAGANIVYAAGQPITNGQGILVPQNSPIRTLADLRGKRVGFTKGSSANNFTIAALESAGLAFADITPVYLNPPDAGPAFASGGIDAWAIWDPYFAIGESRQNARILVNAKDIVKTNSFYIANGDFARRHPGELRGIVSILADVARWAEDHRDEVAKALSEVTNIPLDIQTIAANRSAFAIGPITDEIVETQQGVADRYFRLGLIPNAIVIRNAVWKAPQS